VQESEVREAASALREEIAAAFGAYNTMGNDEDAAVESWEWVERLAERWRIAMERCQLERVGEEFLSDEAVQLYAALESSFILSLSPLPERQAMRLTPMELVGRLLGAGPGIWHEQWEDLHERILTQMDRRVGGPVYLPHATVHRPARLWRLQHRRIRRMHELTAFAGEAYTEIGTFYKELAPDGRALTEQESTASREHLEEAAVADRHLDASREVFSRRDWDVTQLMLAELRSLRRGLALALSDDPARRALAPTVDELGVRTFIMNERVNGAGHEGAIARLTARLEAEA
jgi:hypothetical protein